MYKGGKKKTARGNRKVQESLVELWHQQGADKERKL
jgi:hypothetical protein